MKSLRPASRLIAAALLFAATGCRTAGVNNLAQRDSVPARSGESASELLAEHNRNAEKVQSLEAKPSVSGSNRSRLLPGAGGRLAMERPRNFRLSVSAGMHDVADIGSNDEEFWFWFKDAPDKALYYANYDDSGASPLAAGLQPDWIIEAMGLRVIPDADLARMKVAPGVEPGTVVLSMREKTPRGVEYVKEITLSESTHRVREQRVYTTDRKRPMARAVVSGYDEHPVRSPSGEAVGKVFLPSKLRLELAQDGMALDVSMSEVKVNRLDTSRRQALFREPTKPGFARVNMDERSGLASSEAAAGRPPSVRETMPAPAPRVRLNEPSPLGIDGARRTRTDPPALAADLRPSRARGVEEVVAPPIPTGPDPLPMPRSAWRNSLTPGVER